MSRVAVSAARVNCRLVEPGMAADEGQFVLGGAVGAPLEIMFRVGGLAVLVGAEDADVQVEARVLEIVRVAAVKRDALLGREDQPHVGVTLEAVEMVRAALVQRDHVGAQAGLVLATLFRCRR